MRRVLKIALFNGLFSIPAGRVFDCAIYKQSDLLVVFWQQDKTVSRQPDAPAPEPLAAGIKADAL
jgi:hypothetical protein